MGVSLLVLVGVIYQANKTRSTLDTGNGKDIGFTVHDLAVQSATNTRELLDLSAKLDAHLTDSAADSAELHRVSAQLATHVDDVVKQRERGDG